MATPIASQKERLAERQTASAVKAASPASIHLDAIRGLAALAVFVSHWRFLFFADYPQLQHPNSVVQALYALTGLGHSAVMVFFVLSGFFIASSVFRAQEQGRWSWIWYSEQRLTRLYVVLIPSLLLGAAWDFAGSHFLRQMPIYLAAPEYQFMIKEPVSEMLALQVWFGNLFFLQGIRVPVFGSNGPLWSLSYEFWYYVLFPIGLLALTRASKLIARLGYLGAGVFILVFVGKGIALYFLVWLMGALVSRLRLVRLTESKPIGVLLGLIFVFALLAPRFKLMPAFLPSDFLIAITFTALLYFVVNHKHATPGALYTKAARSLSNISYSLYLLHVPLLIFLNACIIRQSSRWQPDLAHLGLGVLVALLVFAYTYGIWSMTEAQTGFVRVRIAGWIRGAGRNR